MQSLRSRRINMLDLQPMTDRSAAPATQESPFTSWGPDGTTSPWATLFLFLSVLGLSGCGAGGESPPSSEDLGDPSEEAWEGDPVALLASRRAVAGTDEDWRIAAERVTWALNLRLDTLPHFGDVVAAIGEQFVGTTYTPQTLEVPGVERLVINLEELDCVTFIENTLALARMARATPNADLGDRQRFVQAFEQELMSLRYRGGVIDGYPSRLHYFSEWISDNQKRGLVEDVTGSLGGIPDSSAIDFMSTHPDAYRQLADETNLARIRDIETELSGVRRFYIPADEISDRVGEIMNGDLIAATSTVDGLDVAHTGIALWRGGELRLLHAPLVGSAVELSEEPLADRIQRISGQDGIMVARPVDPGSIERTP